MRTLNEWPMREIEQKQFPRLLREITDPPKKLWVRGELPSDEMKFLAVVGSRKNTSYGKDACEKLISGLRGHPVVIVSGLALGIDGIAHKAALDAKLSTIAIPGSGLDAECIYPASHRGLAEKILEAGGCLISEFEPKAPTYPSNFPQRNRVMAGMSHAVLMIEAERRSGTMITQKFATDYDRDVLAVPGSIFSPNSDGPNFLISKGAGVVRSSEDILEALGIAAKTSVEVSAAIASLFADCSQEEKVILELLAEPMSRDELIQKAGKSASEVGMSLSLLEIKGFIAESFGEVHRII